METQSNPTTELAKRMDGFIGSVINHEQLFGFERAYLIATATGELKRLLTSEYMKPIMELQGSRLGFRTDKDGQGGYPENVVRECLIEAVLQGVNPSGNQFNIIAGNSYITKEGYGYLLKKIPGLWYEITYDLPRINQQSTSAAIKMNMTWSLDGGASQTKSFDFPIKMNQKMGTDAVIGKATRKARKWLYEQITGCETGDGDITDLDSRSYTIVSDEEQKDPVVVRLLAMIEAATTLEDLNNIQKHMNQDTPAEVFDAFTEKSMALNPMGGQEFELNFVSNEQ